MSERKRRRVDGNSDREGNQKARKRGHLLREIIHRKNALESEDRQIWNRQTSRDFHQKSRRSEGSEEIMGGDTHQGYSSCAERRVLRGKKNQKRGRPSKKTGWKGNFINRKKDVIITAREGRKAESTTAERKREGGLVGGGFFWVGGGGFVWGFLEISPTPGQASIEILLRREERYQKKVLI